TAGGRVQVAVLILHEVPDVRRAEAGQRLQLPRQPEHALVADHHVLQLGLLVVGRRVLVPDLDLGRSALRAAENERGQSQRERQAVSVHHVSSVGEGKQISPQRHRGTEKTRREKDKKSRWRPYFLSAK